MSARTVRQSGGLVQKITPSLWFPGNASEAVDFYVDIFPDAKRGNTSYYPTEGLLDFQQPLAGKPITVDFEVGGFAFTTINAGNEFAFTQAISFMVNFDPSRDDAASAHLDELWNALLDGGEVMMPLQEYPFSKRYGWIKDKFGLTWQLILTNPEGEERPFIVPSFLFGGPAQNRAEEAVNYYVSLFPDARLGTLAPYPEAVGPAAQGSVMFADFQVGGDWFAAMDSGAPQEGSFNEALSFVIACEDQAEIDAYWEKLSHVPESEQCGWCKDQFGVSWQIIPRNLGELMSKPDAYPTLMQQKKIVIADFG